MESWVHSWWPLYQYVLSFFHSMCPKYWTCHEKVKPSHTKCCIVLHLSSKIILANRKIWCGQMQPLSGNQRQDRRTCLTHASFVTAPATRNASLPTLLKRPTPANDFETATKPSVLLTFGKVQDPLRLPHKTTLQRPKMVRACGAFSMFTSKCASRHNVAHFFQHFNFRKRSGAEVLWAYSLRRDPPGNSA